MKIYISIPKPCVYPSIAVVPFARGLVTACQLENQWQLTENNTPIHSYKEIVAFWPDQTVKWVHVHGIYKWNKSYHFIPTTQQPYGVLFPIRPDSDINWELQVEELKGEVWKNTSQDRNVLQSIPYTDYKLNLIDATGGWSYNGSDETKFVELSNDFVRVTRYEGWLKNGGERSVFRYCTRVTRYALSPFCKISNSIIFAGNMKGRKIKHVSFLIKSLLVQGNECMTGADGEEFVFDVSNSRQPILVHQKAIDHCEIFGGGSGLQIKEKADGYIRRENLAVFVRDFWQKFPQAFECARDVLTYRQWFGGQTPFFDTLIGTTRRRLLDGNLHKLLHWHQGPVLANDIPKTNDPDNQEWADKFYELMAGDEGGEEEFIEYTGYADMQGITIHDDIAVYTGEINTPVYAKMWNNNPVGRCAPDYIESTEVADFAAKGNDFAEVENFMEDSVISYTDPERFEDYGRFVYGDSHRNILPVFNRPSFHRLFLASYYCAGETYWRMRLRGGSNKILALARRNTERYRSIVQVSYDERKGVNGSAETLWHDPGKFWYRGLWWGNVREFPGIPDDQQPRETASGHGNWTSIWGRSPDPDSLRWSWILDGNRYHKDGYELWYRFAKSAILTGGVSPSNARLFNKTIVYTINAYDHFLNHPKPNYTDTVGSSGINLRNHILSCGNMLLSLPLNQITAGPLWQPEWLRTLTEFLSTYYVPDIGEEPKESFIARVLHYVVTNYRSNFYSGQRTLDMTSLMVDIMRNEKYPFYYDYFPAPVTIDDLNLTDHLFWISKIKDEVYKGASPEFVQWLNFGIGDGELGDGFLKLQWGAFLKRLRQLNIDELLTLEYNFHGHYPSSSESRHPFHPNSLRTCYGNEYFVIKDNTQRLDLACKLAPAGMGQNGSLTREIWIVPPAKHLENMERIQTPNTNPTGAKFISVIGSRLNEAGEPITENSYPDGNLNDRKPLDYFTDNTITDYSFDSYSAPHIVNEKVLVYSWDHAQAIRSATGNEDHTVLDSYSVPDANGNPVAERGLYRVFIAGRSAYPGLTATELPEAMILRPITISGNIIYYRYLNSNLYYKNLDDHPVTLAFTAAVEVATLTSRTMYGSFVCVYISTLDESFYLPYRVQPNDDEIITVTLQPGERVRIKTTTIYSNNTCIKMKFDGLLLCAKSLGDMLAFEPIPVEKLRENYYGV